MSRSRRNFSAEFKTNLVLQLLKGKKNLMSLLLKTIFNQISSAIGRKNSLQMRLLLLITSEKTISGKNLPKNARKKPNTPKKGRSTYYAG